MSVSISVTVSCFGRVNLLLYQQTFNYCKKCKYSSSYCELSNRGSWFVIEIEFCLCQMGLAFLKLLAY